jgi:hypothetical protein
LSSRVAPRWQIVAALLEKPEFERRGKPLRTSEAMPGFAMPPPPALAAKIGLSAGRLRGLDRQAHAFRRTVATGKRNLIRNIECATTYDLIASGCAETTL